jgi:hypothetical protein
MMQMLEAGGLPLLTDFERNPDVDNPRGYCEWEPIKRLSMQPELIDRAEGKAVKIISELLLSVPTGRTCKLIFMERPLPEVLASQDQMLKRRGLDQSVDSDELINAFRDHMREVAGWLQQRTDMPLFRMGYRKLLANPVGYAEEIREFLGIDLDLDAMARQVDPMLYRNRRP